MMESDARAANAGQAQDELPILHVAPAPHLHAKGVSTQRMMLDVLIGLAPVVVAGFIVFRHYLLKQVALCVLTAVTAEVLFVAMRRRKATIGDFSAVITGIILALSLPGTAPWYVSVIGATAAIGLGKVVFGGLGQNIFNPAMVGRAFVMFAFPAALAAGGYVDVNSTVSAVTQATPMTVVKLRGAWPDGMTLWNLFLGSTNGSLGETSALACLIGGTYLLIRRTAAWRITVGLLLAVALLGLGGATNEPGHAVDDVAPAIRRGSDVRGILHRDRPGIQPGYSWRAMGSSGWGWGA